MGLRDSVKVNEVTADLSRLKMTIAGRPKSGKAIPITTKVVTPQGLKYAFEIKEGDELIGLNGQPTKVVGVYPQGKLRAYEVTTTDGHSFICNDEHIIPYVENDELKAKTLKEMLEDYIIVGEKFTIYRYELPKAEVVHFEKRTLPALSPWIVGVLLGLKAKLENNTLIVKTNEKDILDRLEHTLFITPQLDNGVYKFTIQEDSTLELLEELLTADQLSDDYVYGSYDTRLELIEGFFASVGHLFFDHLDGEVLFGYYLEFKTKYQDIPWQIQAVMLSLGFNASYYIEQVDGQFTQYIDFVPNRFVVTTYKHKELLNKYPNAKSFLTQPQAIAQIEDLEDVQEMVCFKVDAEDKLFLLDDYIPTHNTSLFYEILKREGGIDTGLLLAFERGYNMLPGINVIDIEDWAHFVEVVDMLEDDNEGFQYIAIDTVDIAGKWCTEYILRKQGRKDGKKYEQLSDIPFGKAYDLLESEFSEQMSRLERAGFGLFFITHDKDRTVKEKSGLEYEKTTMSVSSRAGDYVKNSSDFLIFIDVESVRESELKQNAEDETEESEETEGKKSKRSKKDKKKKGKKSNKIVENRIIRFRGDGTTEAGGRITEIPETIPYDVELFLETIKKAILDQAKLIEQIPSKPSTTTEKPKPKPTVKKQEAIEEVDSKHEEELKEVKQELADIISDMDKDEKKEIGKTFKERLGILDYRKSDNLEELKKILEELEEDAEDYDEDYDEEEYDDEEDEDDEE